MPSKETTIIQSDIQTILNAPLGWSAFYGRTVLITGAGGALASYLVATLMGLNDQALGDACRVLALVRNPDSAATRLGPYLGRDDFELVIGDVVQPIVPLGKIDFILHAASPATGRQFNSDPVGTLRANIIGTDNMLQLALRNPVQGFLMLSSGEVYGQTDAAMISERDYGYLDPATVRACYGEGKRAAETLCVTWAHQYGIATYIARIMHTYGPQIDVTDGRIYSDFAADILAGRNLKIMSDGLARRPFCYVTDAIIGLFTILLKGEVACPYNLGNDEAVLSIRELALCLTAEAFPQLQLGVELPENIDEAKYPKTILTGGQPDLGRLRALGWTPKVNIIEGFRRTVASLSEASLLDRA